MRCCEQLAQVLGRGREHDLPNSTLVFSASSSAHAQRHVDEPVLRIRVSHGEALGAERTRTAPLSNSPVLSSVSLTSEQSLSMSTCRSRLAEYSIEKCGIG